MTHKSFALVKPLIGGSPRVYEVPVGRVVTGDIMLVPSGDNVVHGTVIAVREFVYQDAEIDFWKKVCGIDGEIKKAISVGKMLDLYDADGNEADPF